MKESGYEQAQQSTFVVQLMSGDCESTMEQLRV